MDIWRKSLGKKLRIRAVMKGPGGFAVMLLALVFSSESSIMLALAWLFPHGIGAWMEAALDSSLLTIAIVPAIWALLLRPLRADAKRLRAVNEQLNAALIEKAQAEEQLRHMATHDTLTGLPNRALTFLHLQRMALRRKPQFAVLFLDLDDFKAVNDRYGHALGDRLLQEAATRLQMAVRTGDIVSRWGGDEFVVVVDDAGRAEAEVVAERIREQLLRDFTLGLPSSLRIGVSIGISVACEGKGDVDAYLRKADEEMYRAKHASRARRAAEVSDGSPKSPAGFSREPASASPAASDADG